MNWGLDLRAADPIEANRTWVPLQKNKYRRYMFVERGEAQDAMDAMLRGNSSLELRVVPLEEKA